MTPFPNDPVIVHVFGRTDVGRTREHNEDAFVVADLTRGNATLQPEVRTHVVGDRGTLFMVADGMGGAAAGEIASAMAIEVVMRELTESLSGPDAPTEEEFATAIKRATAAANAQIHSYALEHPEFRGMGTTATVAGVLGSSLYLAQVGDSRAYLVRDGVGRQITKDQSLMQKLIEAGEITEAEAELSERRNIILQALGPEAQIKVDLTHQQIRRGDVLVLCSDGLSGQVRIEEIAAIVTQNDDLLMACKRMIDRANENGGPDNITVITARFDGDGLESPQGTDAVGHKIFPLSTDTGPQPVADGPGMETTGDMPTSRRSTQKLSGEEMRVTAEIPAVPTGGPGRPTPVVVVSPTRRKRGMLVAVGLVILFVAIVGWMVLRATRAVAPRHGGTATPTDTRP